MDLSSLKPAKGSVRDNKRVGRGQGSGMGGTSTRGHKGAQSRSGYSRKLHFEGGQMPIQRRLPKFGFKNINRVEYKAINLDAIQALVEKTGASLLDSAFLQANGLISKRDLVKILGRGEMTSAIEIHADGFSASAKEAIEKAGGKAVLNEDLANADKAIKATAQAEMDAADKAAKEARSVAGKAGQAKRAGTVVAPVVAKAAPVVDVAPAVTAVVETPVALVDETPVAEAPAVEPTPDTQPE